jgi:hypothetical protein
MSKFRKIIKQILTENTKPLIEHELEDIFTDKAEVENIYKHLKEHGEVIVTSALKNDELFDYVDSFGDIDFENLRAERIPAEYGRSGYWYYIYVA